MVIQRYPRKQEIARQIRINHSEKIMEVIEEDKICFYFSTVFLSLLTDQEALSISFSILNIFKIFSNVLSTLVPHHLPSLIFYQLPC